MAMAAMLEKKTKPISEEQLEIYEANFIDKWDVTLQHS